jgi:diguanylate cyclase (GGDEF)-like protein
MTSGFFRRALALILVPALLIALAMFESASVERRNALNSAQALDQTQRLLTAMLDEETGARGYFDTGRAVFLEPWYSGAVAFNAARAAIAPAVAGDAQLQEVLTSQVAIARQWRTRTAAEIARYMAGAGVPSVGTALAQKSLMDSFRAANDALRQSLDQKRNAALSQATLVAVLLAAGLAAGLSLGGLLLMRRAERREDARRRRETELRELMQVSDSEEESRALLIHHIERTVPGAGVAVMNRNNSDDRLEIYVGEGAAFTALRDVTRVDARPRDCLAVRLSRPHERSRGEQGLSACAICGKLAAEVSCDPLLVGGKVIGSVLVASPRRMLAGGQSHLRDAITQAAPIIAHQRNLALAQRRAASDALTGLPNRRAADDNIKRMAAQAGRTASSLAAVMVDLDHFKEINDVHGHDAGDEALAALAPILNSMLRASDFASRYGGEEFLLLLPDTTAAQAGIVAEKIREAVQLADIGPSGLTASFGVSALPADAADPERLVRRADQALYAAKQAGRNCVRLANEPVTVPVD